jgi:chromosome partitioning protein
MKETCNHLRKNYDYILIDTPPSLSLMVGNAFAFADRVLIPYAPEFYSMRSLIKVVNTIKEFKREFNPHLEVLGVLRTLVNMNTNLHTDIIQETNKYALENSLYVFETVIPKTIQFANSVAYDKLPASLLKQNKRDKAQLFFDVWDEIETRLRKVDI